VLLLADTHLGFDLPFHPRVERRRRGPDFFANTERALAPALEGKADLVVHGGDLFYRSRVPEALIAMALAPLIRVADCGVPVYLVPGNHERSRIPLHLWARHPNLHIFDRPRTFTCRLPQATVALAGFPYTREVRDRFSDLVEQTGHEAVQADVRLLCLHQVVEGAQVGATTGGCPYTFRGGADVVRGRDIPPEFRAVLAGHIHRAQVLRRDLAGRPLAAPVIYPGSIERTSFAERDEEKGYVLLDLGLEPASGSGRLIESTFVRLPARPMVDLAIDATGLCAQGLADRVRALLSDIAPDAVVRLRLEGSDTGKAWGSLSAPRLRELAPATMNVDLAPAPGSPSARRGSGEHQAAGQITATGIVVENGEPDE
jgi:DNA repair exonuclease SbcCD nuclease subunit